MGKNHPTCHPHVLQAPKGISVIWRPTTTTTTTHRKKGKDTRQQWLKSKSVYLYLFFAVFDLNAQLCDALTFLLGYVFHAYFYSASVALRLRSGSEMQLWRWCFDEESNAFPLSKNFQFPAGGPIKEVVVAYFMDRAPVLRVSFPSTAGGMWGPQEARWTEGWSTAGSHIICLSDIPAFQSAIHLHPQTVHKITYRIAHFLPPYTFY